MRKLTFRWKAIALVVLGLVEVFSIYQTLFCLWMVSHPVYQSQYWREKLELRVATTAILGIAFITLVTREVFSLRKRPS